MYAIAADGSVSQVIGAYVSGTVEAVQPSRLAAGLVDVTVASDAREPLQAGVLDILERWYDGRPTEPNLWAGYDRQLRHHRAGVALATGPTCRTGRRAPLTTSTAGS